MAVGELWLTKVFTLPLGLFFSVPSQDILGCWGEDPRQALAWHVKPRVPLPSAANGKSRVTSATHLCFGNLKFRLRLSEY